MNLDRQKINSRTLIKIDYREPNWILNSSKHSVSSHRRTSKQIYHIMNRQKNHPKGQWEQVSRTGPCCFKVSKVDLWFDETWIWKTIYTDFTPRQELVSVKQWNKTFIIETSKQANRLLEIRTSTPLFSLFASFFFQKDHIVIDE